MPRSQRRGILRREQERPPGSDLSDLSELSLVDVTLVTDVTGRRTEVRRLGLGFDHKGMTVHTPDGAPSAFVPWALLRSITADAAEVAGEPGAPDAAKVALEVSSDRRTHHFEVPNVQPEALSALLSSLAVRYAPVGLSVSAGKGRSSKSR